MPEARLTPSTLPMALILVCSFSAFAVAMSNPKGPQRQIIGHSTRGAAAKFGKYTVKNPATSGWLGYDVLGAEPR